MKTLFVMRHAKSSWDNPALTDFERTLNARGLQAAPKMGELMRGKSLAPELIVASPAARARETAEIVNASAKFNCEIRFEPRVYEARAADLFEVIRELPDEFAAVLIIGHNPGLEDLVRHLTAEIREMPTAALAHIELDVKAWQGVGVGVGKLVNLYKPKEKAD